MNSNNFVAATWHDTPNVVVIRRQQSCGDDNIYDIFHQLKVCFTTAQALGHNFAWPVWDTGGSYGLTQEEVGQLMGGN